MSAAADSLGRTLVCHVDGCAIKRDANGKVVVEGPTWVDWPIMYADGRVAYDRPEAFTKRVKRAVERELKRRS